MNKLYANMETSELVAEFEKSGLEQWEKIILRDIRKLKILLMDSKAISDELRTRGLESRRALTVLYNHPNVQVRLRAAQASYGAAPLEARTALQTVADTGIYPQAADAKLSIEKIDNGTTLLT